MTEIAAAPSVSLVGLLFLLAAYEECDTITAEGVRLSRQNTNVRSLDLSLGRKVKVLAVCDEALLALKAQLGGGVAKATK